jgi:signal transduction histidine kinase
MSFEASPDFAEQVADLNKYGQALNNCESVDEVASLTIEAMSHLFEFPYTSIVEVRNGDLRVIQSTYPEVSPGDEPGAVVRRAYDTKETVMATGAEAGVEGDETEIAATMAVPAVIVDEVAAIIVARTGEETEFGDEVSRPLEILASHAATAISNIRSRERLERARRDLEKRKEMVEMYDRLLRHDIGNDLQVIAAFSEQIAEEVDGDAGEYAERVHSTARSSADLVERVGDLMKTLEEQAEPSPQDLRAVLEDVVANARAQYESLTVEFTPEAFNYRVYGGDLLDSVFTNVITNAAVHNAGEVHVRLSVEATATEVTVSIADDGEGIDDEVADRLFEMGAKGPDSEGTGFGLGFVKALTESYGGTTRVQESEWGGADFRITLERV